MSNQTPTKPYFEPMEVKQQHYIRNTVNSALKQSISMLSHTNSNSKGLTFSGLKSSRLLSSNQSFVASRASVRLGQSIHMDGTFRKRYNPNRHSLNKIPKNFCSDIYGKGSARLVDNS